MEDRRWKMEGGRWKAGMFTLSILVWAAIASNLCILNAAERFAGEFLTLGVGARALGMGGSFVAVADDSTAAYWNPAGLGGLNHSEISFMHSSLFGLDSYSFINYSQAFKEKGTFALTWIRLGVDDIPITTVPIRSSEAGSLNRPKITGHFSNVDNAFLISYGRKIELQFPVGLYESRKIELLLGGSGKFIFVDSYRNHNAIGFGGDLGSIWRLGNLSFGAVIHDFSNTKIFWNTPPESLGEPANKDSIQPNLKIGIAYLQNLESFKSRFIISADMNSKYSFEKRFGLEYVLSDLLALRAGIEQKNGLDADQSRYTAWDITAGAGLRLGFVGGSAFAVDYAFLSSELGNSNRVSAMIRF